MVGIISRYKSDIIEYAKKEDIKKEEYVAMCTQADVKGNKNAVDTVVVLEKPWRGFDLETVALYVCKEKKDDPEKPVKPEKLVEKVVAKAEAPAKVIPKPKKAAPKTALFNRKEVKDEHRLNPELMYAPGKSEPIPRKAKASSSKESNAKAKE